MKIHTLMSSNVITVEMDDSLAKVKTIFDEKGFHHLLVIENTKLVGMISDRDLLKAISPKVGTLAANRQDLATLNKRAHQIMSRNPVYLNETATVVDAINLFNNKKISCIPIVNDHVQPVGIVSWRDIMAIISQKINGH